jgi:hypothetical protein
MIDGALSGYFLNRTDNERLDGCLFEDLGLQR